MLPLYHVYEHLTLILRLLLDLALHLITFIHTLHRHQCCSSPILCIFNFASRLEYTLAT